MDRQKHGRSLWESCAKEKGQKWIRIWIQPASCHIKSVGSKIQEAWQLSSRFAPLHDSVIFVLHMGSYPLSEIRSPI